MKSVIGYFQEIFQGLWLLGIGLSITAKHVFRRPITLQYPSEKRIPGKRYRGLIRLVVDPATHQDKCVACMVCAIHCPNNCIRIVKDTAAPAGVKRAKEFDLDYSICLFCGICVQDCPYDALTITGEHEFAVTDKKELVWDIEKMRLETTEVLK